MRHQRAVGRLYKLLDAACPPEFEVFVAPFAVVLAEDTVMQPDVLVAKVSDHSLRTAGQGGGRKGAGAPMVNDRHHSRK